MALAALFLRLATVLALKGQTLAGDSVGDSQINPIDQRAKDNRAPALVVYTDDAVVDQIVGRDMLTGDRQLQLSIEMVVASEVAGEVEGESSVIIPETDEGLELSLNLIERQILRALQAGSSPWAEIWRTLIVRVRKIESQRGAGLKDGVRFAARQMVLTIEPMAEPGFGQAAVGVWRAFLDQLALEPDLAGLVPLLEAEILGEAIPNWKIAQALLGLTNQGIEGIGLPPPYLDPIEDGPVLEQITLSDEVGDWLIEDGGPAPGGDGTLNFSNPDNSALA